MRSAFILLFALLSLPIYGQVWPGDINSNGEVDHLDLLYLGYSYGTVGPRRDSASISWAPQTLLSEWAQKFPGLDSLNYGHADCNGDGIISILDLLAINNNFDEQTNIVTPNEIVEGIAGIDPPIQFESSSVTGPLLQGSILSIPLNLGNTNFPIDEFNGIAFTVKYDPSAIKPSSIHLFTGSTWVNSSGNELLQLQKNDAVEGELDVAISRFGINTVDGQGPIGSLYFIIEDDVIDFLPEDSLCVSVTLDEIVLINDQFEQIPVVSDSLKLKIVSPNYFTTSVPDIIKDDQVLVYPNPVNQTLSISAVHRHVEEVSLFDALGRQVYYSSPNRKGLLQIPVKDYAPGLYVLKLLTPEGIISRKILKEDQ